LTRKSAHPVGAIIGVVTIAITAFVAGRLSTTSWPIGGDSLEHACAEYMKVRAAFVQAERDFEARHSPYRYPVHAAVYRAYERPDAYLERVSATAAHAEYVQRRDNCARHLAAQRKVAE
jgi:hypothetical protein